MSEDVLLTSLLPEWWAETPDRFGQGISFECPHCHAARLIAAFLAPLDGKAPSQLARIYHDRRGESFEDLSVMPTIDFPGHGHVLIYDGVVTIRAEKTP